MRSVICVYTRGKSVVMDSSKEPESVKNVKKQTNEQRVQLAVNTKCTEMASSTQRLLQSKRIARE